jgi:hypothetical protein
VRYYLYSVLPPLDHQKDADKGRRCWLVKVVRDLDKLGCAVQGCVQTYKKASVNVFHVRCHVQGLLGQGVAAVAVCKAATSEDKAEAARHADLSASTKSAAVPATHKAVELASTSTHAQVVVDLQSHTP